MFENNIRHEYFGDTKMCMTALAEIARVCL